MNNATENKMGKKITAISVRNALVKIAKSDKIEVRKAGSDFPNSYEDTTDVHAYFRAEDQKVAEDARKRIVDSLLKDGYVHDGKVTAFGSSRTVGDYFTKDGVHVTVKDVFHNKMAGERKLSGEVRGLYLVDVTVLGPKACVAKLNPMPYYD